MKSQPDLSDRPAINGHDEAAEFAAGTTETIASLLGQDTKVKVAGVDCDGVLRGKIMSKEKFLSSVNSGFAMSSAIFGWDMHDELYTTETNVARKEEGYSDFIAVPDLDSYRRLPFEDDLPFFLLNFIANGRPVSACGRSVLKKLCQTLRDEGVEALAGVELEFMNFQTPTEDGYGASGGSHNLAAWLSKNAPEAIRPLTAGMFGYSVTRPVMNKQYFHRIYDDARKFDCGIESWHTESGPGVFEAALGVSPIEKMADKVTAFKFLVKAIGIESGATPCFMAKPVYGLPGNSGHIHISLVDKDGHNIFARSEPDTLAMWPDIEHLSDLGRYFLAGLLEALPDLMPLFAPTINSYKRLVENYWAPVDVTWGLEHRLSSVRLVAPPVCKPEATRFEVRIPGADMHPHYALTAILGAGWRGVQRKADITVPPSASRPEGVRAVLLPNTLEAAVAKFRAPQSLAREIFSDEFVDFFAATREHEIRLWREAVTDWEFRRYIETA